MRRGQAGFTLLELLVVVAILVIVAGGLIAAYDGLEKKSAQGVATFDIAALDSAVRTFRATNNGLYPDSFDSLLFTADGSATDATVLNLINGKLAGKIGGHTLTAEGVAALDDAGITTLRYVDGTAATPGYDNAALPAGTQVSIPNRVFDNPSRGHGASVPLTAGVVVAAVENILQADSTGATPADSSRLRDIAGLDETIGHVVIAVGVGNNSTLVHNVNGRTDLRGASLSQAPLYKNIEPNLYGRYIAVFHLASDADASGTIDAGEFLGTARFLGIIDTKGDWYEEEEAEFTGVKS